MLARYLKNQGIVLLCGGLVGPIFLVVYFALGPMARPELNWMFWTGLVVTAVDVLAALALTSSGARSAARHEQLTRTGVLCAARITGIRDTSLFVNEQQMIKVDLHVDMPGTAGFDTQLSVPASPARMRVLNGHRLMALVEPGTQNYEIDWNASALLAGAVPAEFTVDEDRRTYNLTGREDSLLQILNVLHVNGIPLGGTIDIRSNPAVRQQVIDIVRRAAKDGAAQPTTPGPSAEAPSPSPLPIYTPPPPTVSQRLQELETLRATGAVTQAEYDAKRLEILNDL
jgi:hypothetical protein